MSAMLPIFYGEVPDTGRAPLRNRPDESGLDAARNKDTKKKRILTEARKEQNRAAQRLFRQRQRERRQQLQEFTKKPPAQRELRPRARGETRRLSLSSSDSGQTFSYGGTTHSGDSSSPSVIADDDHLPDIQLIPHSVLTAAMKASMPDPAANTLEFLPTTVFGACLHNALALGVDPGDLAMCGPEGLSPFYRPSSPGDDPAALFSQAMSSLSRKPPPNLLPTLTQILIPHHPSLDLIPLPHLRDQAIVLSASMPQIFNIWELKLDIYQRGGLVMLKRRIDKDGRMRSCQPWEKSSWVAQPWFLRKWSMLVVGEKDQLSQAVPCNEAEIYQ